MSSIKNKYVRHDDRTGRLERAISLVNDGQDPSLVVARGEADKYNPQTRKMRIPLDRVAINGKSFAKELVSGPTNILVGYDSGANAGTNWERPSVPSIHYGLGGGYITMIAPFGFGDNGFGQYGFGGALTAEEIAV